jgi:hypothetical protein
MKGEASVLVQTERILRTSYRNNSHALIGFLELVRLYRIAKTRPPYGKLQKDFHLSRWLRPADRCHRDRLCSQQDNWAGDGQSTILFDKYAEFHPGSVFYSVYLDPKATAFC